MGDWPNPSPFPVLGTIMSIGWEAAGFQLASGLVVPSAGSALQTLGTPELIPFRLAETAKAVSMSILIGGTPAGNVRLGIYNEEFILVADTAATASGSANSMQTINLQTPLFLHPGKWYMTGFVTSGGNIYRVPINNDELFQPGYMYLLGSTSSGAFVTPLTPTMNTNSTLGVPIISVNFE